MSVSPSEQRRDHAVRYLCKKCLYMFWGSKKRVKAHMRMQGSAIRGCIEMATPEEEEVLEREDREGRKGGRVASCRTSDTPSCKDAIEKKQRSAASHPSTYAKHTVSYSAQPYASAQNQQHGKGGRVKLTATLPRGAVTGGVPRHAHLPSMHVLAMPVATCGIGHGAQEGQGEKVKQEGGWGGANASDNVL